MPDRPLSTEARIVLDHGDVRGADLWHLSSALYLAGDPARLPFLTLDQQQESIARSIGFPKV